MDRKRKIALGVATLAVALATGSAVQRLVPQDHPALTGNPASGAGAGDLAGVVPPAPDIGGAAITPLAADVAQTALPSMAAPLPAAPQPLQAEADTAADVAAAAAAAAGLLDSLRAAMPDDLPETLAAPFLGTLDRLPALAPGHSRVASAPAPADAVPMLSDAPLPSDDLAADAPAAPDCTPVLLLAAAPAAMIDVAFDAPCHPGTRAVIRHAGLAVTGATSAAGMLDVSLPAFASPATVTVALTGGPEATAQVAVPDLGAFDRIAVQWQNDDAFQLHAFEGGAGFGEPGHVSAVAPADIGAALRGTGGYMLLLGDSGVDWPLLAEVYSHPVASATGAAPQIAVEAAVNPDTCGRDLLGEVLKLQQGGALRRVEITLPMPECDGSEGFILLNNLFDEMTLARN